MRNILYLSITTACPDTCRDAVSAVSGFPWISVGFTGDSGGIQSISVDFTGFH